mgnify:CR=1 FL=1|jgi:hypothetical protein
MNLNVDKIFCCHHPSEFLKSRKERLVNFFKENDIDVEWVEGFPPEEAENYDYSGLVHRTMTRGPMDCRTDEAKAKDLSRKGVSLILKHNYCYEQQIENNYKNILILEDDVDLSSGFSEQYFNKCMREFEAAGLEMLYLGSCCEMKHPEARPDKYVYYDHYTKPLPSRCTHCYVVSTEGARKTLKHSFGMFDSVDWQLNWIIEKEKIKNSWAEPSVRQLNLGSSLNSEGDLENLQVDE